ncbi:transmembrane protein 17B-like isoform X1 [Lucilia sericata]|uniref:transmembrane protein 17B-like isoform X1 n=1 Tax=Lucilia sericata TaxID=13632 RepID=UPI0018A7F0BC|nr:transmembrane protein 17B-like isoform X1 [Lucilia sericata]XP_037809594.1 transmembrane protein 17B-like isoform X1 [Lucilia sericata]
MNNTIRELPYKPSLILQILMFCNVYLSIAWNVVYGFYILYNVSQTNTTMLQFIQKSFTKQLSNLYDLHGICVIVAYLVGSIVEFYRLRMGYKGNLHSRPGDLCTFLILSPFVQLPVLLFLLLSAQNFSTLITSIALCSFVVMGLEFVFGLAILWPKSEKPINVNK